MAEKKEMVFMKFFKGVKSEFKKIVWSTPKQLINNTVIVIAAIIAIGAVIWLLDTVLQFVLTKLLIK